MSLKNPRTLYIFKSWTRPGEINIGEVWAQDVLVRIPQKMGSMTAKNGVDFNLLWTRADLPFRDIDVHEFIKKHYGAINTMGEWYSNVTFEQVKTAVNYLLKEKDALRINNFPMREEQELIVEKAVELLQNGYVRILFNVKPRTGKTFICYQIIIKMAFNKILIVSAKTATKCAWFQDLMTHQDFTGYSFTDMGKDDRDSSANVHFASKQFLDKNPDSEVFLTKYNLVIFDEEHFAKETDNGQYLLGRLQRDYTFYLSGTPYGDLRKGIFDPEEMIHWTLLDEQKAKLLRKIKGCPRDVEPPTLHFIIDRFFKQHYDQNDNFNADKFFEVKNGEFVNKAQVILFLDWLSGIDNSKFPVEAPYNGYSPVENFANLLLFFSHKNTIQAMDTLIHQHKGFKGINVVNLGTSESDGGTNAIDMVNMAFKENERNIVLSCGKAGTGTTIDGLDCVLMLNNLSESDTAYIQYAFRCQTPAEGKDNSYVMDFSPYRAAKMINSVIEMESMYHNSVVLDKDIVLDFTDYVPVWTVDGDTMTPISGLEIVDKIQPFSFSQVKVDFTSDLNFDPTKATSTEGVLRNVVMPEGQVAQVLGTRIPLGKNKGKKLKEDQVLTELGNALNEAGLRSEIDEENDYMTLESAIPEELDKDASDKEKKDWYKREKKKIDRGISKLMQKVKQTMLNLVKYMYSEQDKTTNFLHVKNKKAFKDICYIEHLLFYSLTTIGLIKQERLDLIIPKFWRHPEEHSKVLSDFYPKLSFPPIISPSTEEPITIYTNCEKMNSVGIIREQCPNAILKHTNAGFNGVEISQEYMINRNAFEAGSEEVSYIQAMTQRFDYVVGNCPFFDESEPSKKGKALYPKYFDEAFALDFGEMRYLLPSNILTKPTQYNQRWWNKFISLTCFKEIHYWRRWRNLFSVDNKNMGGLILVVIDKSYSGSFKFINHNTSTETIHDSLIGFTIPDGEDIDIIGKVTNAPDFESMERPRVSIFQKRYGFRGDATNCVLAPDEENNIKIYAKGENIYYTSLDKATNQKGKSMILKDDILNTITKWRVIVTGTISSDETFPKISHHYILEPGAICTDTFIVFVMDSKIEAENFNKFLDTNYFSYAVIKSAQGGKNIRVLQDFQWVPKLDWTKEHNDEELAKKYGFNLCEIELLETRHFY